MKSLKKNIVYILALGLLIIAAYYGFYDNDQAKAVTYKNSNPMPYFSINLVYENSKPISEQININDFKGHYTLVNFFASWCPPCKAELPYFQQVYNMYAPYGFRILAISMDDNESDLMDFLKNKNYTFDIAIHSSGLGSKFNITGLPTSYLLDPKGNIIKVVYGEYLTLGQDLKNIYQGFNEPR